MAEKNDTTVESTDTTEPEAEAEDTLEMPEGMYVEGDDDDEQATPETGEAPAEDAELAAEEPEADADEEAAPEAATTDPDKVNWPKKVERLSFEMGRLRDDMRTLLERIDAQNGRVSPKQREQLEELNDKAEDLIEVADDEAVSGATFKTVLNRLKAVETNQGKIGQQTAEQAARQDFVKHNPELAGQYDNVLAAAQQRMAKEFADVTDAGERRGIARVVWDQEIAAAKAAAKASPTAGRPNVVRANGKPSAKSASTSAPPRVSVKGASRGTPTPDPDSEEFDAQGNPIMPRGMWTPG